jgi:hypothetical protein
MEHDDLPMKHDDLIEFLAISAAELLRSAETTDLAARGPMLDEASELLFLTSRLLARRTMVVLRRAA